MNILETQYIQREYDNRWEKVVKIHDHDNSYTYNNEEGVKVKYIPEKWIVVDVLDVNPQETINDK